MEIQKHSDVEQENSSPEKTPTEDSEKRIYNGFQGPLTETAENNMRPQADSSSSSAAVHSCVLLLLFPFL